MNRTRQNRCYFALLLLILLLYPAEVLAEELPAVQTVEGMNEIISVVMPVIEDRKPFNFLIDPNGFLYNTFENSEEGVVVEKDAPLLFVNRADGKKGLSSSSDRLTVTNRSTVPVRITVSAKLDGPEGLILRADRKFGEEEDCSLYLALVDDEGNELPLSGEEEVFLTTELEAAPIGAYAYAPDEETGEYRYAYQLVPDLFDFDIYSFGLIGDCNAKGDWSRIKAKPEVVVSWKFEPVRDEKIRTEAAEEHTLEQIKARRPVLTEEEADPDDTDQTMADSELEAEESEDSTEKEGQPEDDTGQENAADQGGQADAEASEAEDSSAGSEKDDAVSPDDPAALPKEAEKTETDTITVR